MDKSKESKNINLRFTQKRVTKLAVMLIDQTFPQINVSLHPKIKVSERRKITSSHDAYEILKLLWDMDTIYLFEEFYVLYLDRKNGVMGYRNMNRGSNCGTVVDTKLILSIALKISASSIILSHNHPSGNMKPSHADTTITNKIKKGAEFLDLKMLDHLIVSPETFYSFADEGII